MPLSRLDVAALRKANTVSFHYTQGRAFIRATKRMEPSERDPFAPKEVSVEIECASCLRSYDDDIKPNAYKAFDMIHSAQLHEEWQTIAALAREGDEVTLHWQAGAWTSETLKDKGLVGDVLYHCGCSAAAVAWRLLFHIIQARKRAFHAW